LAPPVPTPGPPLPRESLRQTRTLSSRGMGGGGGTTSCRHGVGKKSHQPHASNPGGRPQLGVRRVRRLPMRSEPALNPNGHAPALIDVHEAPTSSTSIEPE
jgi:hypothetical protein